MDLAPLAGLRRALLETAPDGLFALAYSGGLDSRFLAHAAGLFGMKPLLLHVTGPHIPPEETAFAREWAEKHALPFREVPVDPLRLPPVAAGARDRCYACKKELFSRLLAESSLPLCDGTNASDASAYRPGIRAVRELGVISPLALAGLGKKEIHFLAGSTGMEHPMQKARPCLLTRLPYGTTPTREILSAVAAGEAAARAVLAREKREEVDLRLRLPAPDRPELHLLASDMESMGEAFRDELLREVRVAMPGYPRPVLSAQASLSGFFDRT